MTANTHSTYREIQPPRALSNRLACLWTQDIAGEGIYQHPVLPDGCVDIVWIGQSSPIVAGPATRRMIVDLSAGVNLVGIRFQPGWAGCSLGVTLDQIVNQDVLLSDIWKQGSSQLTEQLFRSNTTREKLKNVAEGLATLFAGEPSADFVVQFSVRWLINHPAGLIRDLANLVDLSERQLQRRFRFSVGYAPKTFQRIMRLQRLLAESKTRQAENLNLADAALRTGYADQAHMCREVRALTGESPHTLFQRKTLSTVSELFNTDGL